MESEFSPDKTLNTPPVPIKTYKWEDLRREREIGAYPWTHLLKPPLEGEITAEDIIRETTPRRSMSRDVSRSRTHTPDHDVLRILNLDSSPGSSRKHGEEGEDEGVHIPNFSKEVSLDCDENPINEAVKSYQPSPTEVNQVPHLCAPIEIPKNVSPKSILKRKTDEAQFIPITETREKTKCCHPLVNKIKHLADKTLHKLDKNDNEKSPSTKRRKNEGVQEIRQLKASPGASRRQKFSAIKLGDSDEMSRSMSIDSKSPAVKKKEHIYEDIEESKTQNLDVLQPLPDAVNKSISSNDTEIIVENKSYNSEDPSLFVEDNNDLRSEEHVMEILHKKEDTDKEAIILDFDSEEPNIDEIFQNQLEEIQGKESPNITITEINEDEAEKIESKIHQVQCPEDVHDNNDWSKPNSMSKLRRWTSEGGKPLEKPVRPTREGSVQLYTPDVRCACQFFQSVSLLPERLNPVGTRPTSRASNFMSNVSDHEYEIIEKPPPEIIYTTETNEVSDKYDKKEDDLSSTTSLDRRCLQQTSYVNEQDDEDLHDINENDHLDAEALQKDIEDRYFVNTPSTVSRTECEISTSQVDSSALENLPLKRENRTKNVEGGESKIQVRIREGTGKLKSQASKLKTKLQSIKNKQFSTPDKPKIKLPDRPKFKLPDRPKISLPDRPKFTLPDRPKFTLPDRPKFTLPDRRKFSLPDRPKFKKINISEKLSLGDRKKFSFPDRPKFNVPDLSKLKFPDRAKVNLPSFARKKEPKLNPELSETNTEIRNVNTSQFETKTYPRLFKKKKKTEDIMSSSPTINKEDTPPPTFTFTRIGKDQKIKEVCIPDSPVEPREYGNMDNAESYFQDKYNVSKSCDTPYDFDKIDDDFIDKDDEFQTELNKEVHGASNPDISPSKQEYSHVINEINNDEFFVRPRGISRENIQVREYLSDEIRQAFKIPTNALALMGSSSIDNIEPMYANETDADPELLLDENETLRYSTEDLNDKDDGYYTFPPVRPNRAKRKKIDYTPTQYNNENTSMHFSDVDLIEPVDQDTDDNIREHDHLVPDIPIHESLEYPEALKSYSQNNFNFDELIDDMPIQIHTLPSRPRRKKKIEKNIYHSSLNEIRDMNGKIGEEPQEEKEEVIVYRTEHEYIVPEGEKQILDSTVSHQSPIPPRRSRNRSRSSHGTSLCDDDRTSHGAESLTLDTHLPVTEDMDINEDMRQESPGYATVDKGGYNFGNINEWNKNKTPPPRRRKSNSSERKYYTVGPTKVSLPNKPPRKKSSTSLMTLNSVKNKSESSDITQYVEIDDHYIDEAHKDLKSGEVISKMKDRPLPPPPRPPRDPKRKSSTIQKQVASYNSSSSMFNNDTETEAEVVEIEVSTQTDPLPDDIDFELCLDENFDVSMSSSLHDIIGGESMKSLTKIIESPRQSRPVSRSEKSLNLSDPKIAELSKSNIGRTSPTVILVERRVSSPTRINEHDTILTEASLTVQHIDVDESVIPDVPPLPASRSRPHISRDIIPSRDNRTLERLIDMGKDIEIDNLVTQRLQVKDLDVGRLNVSELQASKILVSDIEGMTLQVTELDSKSGHISVSGIEFSQTIIDEIVKKFAELSTPTVSASEAPAPPPRPFSREDETQTEELNIDKYVSETKSTSATPLEETKITSPQTPRSNFDEPTTSTVEEPILPPQRPPPPDLNSLLYSYLQDLSTPPASFYHLRTPRDRPFTDFHESQQSSSPPLRRPKRKAPRQTETSSDDDRPRPSPRRAQSVAKMHNQSITEAGAHFLRVCHSSFSRTMRNIFNSFLTYISGSEDKKDVQMALVIFLVLIAGLIMFGLSDSRTIHHHHWEFFNPSDSKQ